MSDLFPPPRHAFQSPAMLNKRKPEAGEDFSEALGNSGDDL